MEKIMQVRLREAGQAYYFKYLYDAVRAEDAACLPKAGDYVILESDRGQDYGYIIMDTQAPLEHKAGEANMRKILRKADNKDIKQIDENKAKAKDAQKECLRKISDYKLEMKLVDCEYSFDRSKIIFYFTAEARVDFRDLVKELAKILKARIELRQIGVRDEAKFLGGFGVCGRELCCAAFLKDFEPVMIKMAKEQGLPLNPPKISGLCGRLMCCLSYEYQTYIDLSKGLPKEGDFLDFSEGKGKVVSVNKLKRCCMLEFDDGSQVKKEYK